MVDVAAPVVLINIFLCLLDVRLEGTSISLHYQKLFSIKFHITVHVVLHITEHMRNGCGAKKGGKYCSVWKQRGF